jgi:tRNA G18 (ribose-2'-O)-methylase SpoU
MKVRNKTRRERYQDKEGEARTYPISLACINFQHDGNLGYLIRSAACFGAEHIHVIGSVPPRSVLNPLSGSLYDYVKIKQHNSPTAFLDYVKDNEVGLVSAEICEGAESIASFKFDFDSPLVLVVGNEELGIPVEILKNSKKIYIPMPGIGFCLNTSQAANILLYEAVKQYDKRAKAAANYDAGWEEQGWCTLP